MRSVARCGVRLSPGLIFAIRIMAQDPAPVGIVHGVVIECGETELVVRNTDDRVYRFAIDSKTFIQRDHFRIPCEDIGRGEPVEVVSDRSNEPGTRYARLVTVVRQEVRQRRRPVREPLPVIEDPTLSIAPRGSLTFTGVVLRLDGEGLVLRTRGAGEKWILFRRDTRFRADGLVVESSTLQSSTRVFVRAGTNLDGEMEAYEVVWGEILTPAAVR
jgi:hypothetical protein